MKWRFFKPVNYALDSSLKLSKYLLGFLNTRLKHVIPLFLKLLNQPSVYLPNHVGLPVLSFETAYSLASILVRSSWTLNFRRLYFLILVISSLFSLFFRVILFGQNNLLFIVWPFPPFLKSLPGSGFFQKVHCMFPVLVIFWRFLHVHSRF